MLERDRVSVRDLGGRKRERKFAVEVRKRCKIETREGGWRRRNNRTVRNKEKRGKRKRLTK